MKAKLTRALSALALGCLSIGLVSCDPEKPQDERKNKLHENPHRAVYTLIEGELDADEFGDKPELSDVDIVKGSEQQISFSESKEKGWAIEEGSKNKEFNVKSAKESPNTVYILKIDYYSPSGAHMNHQFIDNGQDRIHQHFFSLYKEGVVVRNASKLPYAYVYADTTPWNKEDGELTGPENPIGFKGIIRFTGSDLRFNLNADLLHGFVPKTQFGPQPFYAPSAELRSNSDMDISLKLPIVIGNGSKNIGDDKKEDTPKQPVDPKQPEGPAVGKGNQTKATKIVIDLFEGHLHSETSFHYVPGPSGFKTPHFKMEKQITLVYKDEQWKVAEGDMTWLLLRQINQAALSDGPGNWPAPVYGMWIKYYDASGKEITGEFSDKDTYQHFFSVTDVEPILGGQFSAEDKKTENLINYIYRDTTPWDKSSKQGGKFNDDKGAVGLKGFFSFKKSKLKFNLKIDLWDTKGHKVDSETGKASPFYMPSEEIKKNGKHLISVSVPVYMPTDTKFYEHVANQADDIDDLDQVVLSDQGEEFQKNAKYFMDLFKVTWEELRKDLYILIWGDRGDEKSGVWF